MKIQLTLKTLLVMLMSFCSQTVWGQGCDDFSTLSSNSLYADFKTAAGWTVTNSSRLSSFHEYIDEGYIAVCINGKTTDVGTITSPLLSGGCGTLRLKYACPYAETKGVSFNVAILKNGSIVKEYDVVNTSVAQKTAYEWEQEINVSDEFVIYIINNSPSKNSKSNADRYAIWNINWSAYGESMKSDQTLIFSSSSCTADLSEEDFEEPTLTGAMTTVEYSSSNTSVATVDAESGAVTLKGVGETMITATAAENDEYLAGSASYVLAVTDGSEEETYDGAYALVAEYENGHYALTNAAKGEDALAAIDATPNIVNGKYVMDAGDVRNSISWVITPDTKAGSYTIKTLDGDYLTGTEDGTPLTVDIKKCVWAWSEEYGTWVTGNRSFIYGSTSGYFKNFALSNIGKGGFAGATISMPFTDGYTRNVASGNIGTICLAYDVDAADVKGAEFYSVLGKRTANGEVVSVLFVKEAEGLKAGVPYVFRPTADLLVVAYAEGTSVDNPTSANGLYGSFAGESVAEGMYLLSGNKIVKCGTGSKIGANRAYVNMDEVPEYSADSNVKPALEIGGNGVVNSIDGIDVVDSGIVDVYSISGVRLRCGVNAERALDGLSKGVYVVNGKKVVVK